MSELVFFIVSITILISFFYYKKFKGTIYKYFIYYLVVTFVTELLYRIVLFYYNNYDIILFNHRITYNLYAMVSFLFFFQFYKALSKNKTNKKIFSAMTYLFLGYLLFDIFIMKHNILQNFNTHLIIFGGVLLLITLIVFLIEIINNDKIIFNISKSLIFWISVGLLFFYVGIIPIMITREFLNYNGTYTVILLVLNIIMYGSFIIGMVKSDTKYNY